MSDIPPESEPHPEPTEEVDSPARELFAKILEKARKGLIDTGKRNRLIHTKRPSQRTKALDIIDELSDEVFRLLSIEKKQMSFLPGAKGAADTEGVDAEELEIYAPPEDDGNGVADRHVDTKLQTRLTPEGLQKRMLSLFRDATTIEEEQGISVLYLALGFLQWYESPTSEVLRESPLVLLPVALERSSAKSGFRLSIRDDDLDTNLSLAELLKQEFGIILPEIDYDDGWTPSDYISQVEQAVHSQPRWKVDTDGMVLGFFSFAKLLMYRDLDSKNWPDESLLKNPLLQKLLNDGFEATEPIFPPDESIDKYLDPKDLIHIVDADASQTEVIERVRRGDNLVIQGPPGTGKSQTITNLIGAAVHDGKSVLFMAEKIEALNVVHFRLERANLDRIMLELHSKKTNKKEILEKIDATLNRSVQAATDDSLIDELRNKRDRLNAEADLMHTQVGNAYETPYSIIGELARQMELGRPAPELEIPDTVEWTLEELTAVNEDIYRLINRTQEAGIASEHPWRGVGVTDLQRPDIERLRPRIDEFSAALEAFFGHLESVQSALGISSKLTFGQAAKMGDLFRLLNSPPALAHSDLNSLFGADDISDVTRTVGAGVRLLEIQDLLSAELIETAWDVDVTSMRMGIAASKDSFFRFLNGRYRQSVQEFKSLRVSDAGKNRDKWVETLDLLIEGRKLKGEIEGRDGLLRPILRDSWKDLETDFRTLANSLEWLQQVKSFGFEIRQETFAERLEHPSAELETQYILALGKLEPLFDALVSTLKIDLNEAFDRPQLRNAEVEAVATSLDLDLKKSQDKVAFGEIEIFSLLTRAREWVSDLDRIHEWMQLKHFEDKVRRCNLGDLVDKIADGRLSLEDAPEEFRYARAEQLWNHALRSHDGLRALDGQERSKVISEFRAVDRRRCEHAKKEILVNHDQNIPRGSAGPMRVIRSEIAKKRRHLPIRKLMAQAGPEVQRIKPVMLMSPMSVAQFLPPGEMKFDLLLIDEASQVKPEDALGAIARSTQIVVVGDNKQLPPSQFFDKLISSDEVGNEDEDVTEDIRDQESILKLCQAAGMPDAMLSWHYRSHHPSLIAVSNDEFYKNGLFFPPSPVYESDELGFVVKYVPGIYDRGGKTTNDVEAREIIKTLVSHVQKHPDRSVGVVTFSTPQSTLIQNLLEHERRKNPDLERLFMTGTNGEKAFVKNLETVQGDERDFILVSIGYGPSIAGSGLPSMNFGAVSKEGGERRLNVLFTRARYRCEVYASFRSGDIDLERTTKDGPRVLKRFLRYGETGQLELPEETGLGADSPFEEAVAKAIRQLGYEVDMQVGSAGFRIDLAVKNPKRRGEHLLAVECDGATYHSARWARERDRLRQEVLESKGWKFHRIWSTDWFNRPEREKEKLSARIRELLDGAQETKDISDDPPPAETILIEVSDIDNPSLSLPDYTEASVDSGNSNLEPHEVPLTQLEQIVEKIVEVEGPIHSSEVARRVANGWGKSKVGKRILEHVTTALIVCESNELIDGDGGFWDNPDRAASPHIRSRLNASTTVRKATMLPPSEIRALARQLIEQNGEMPLEDLVPVIAKTFGFQRTGNDLKAVIEDALRP